MQADRLAWLALSIADNAVELGLASTGRDTIAEDVVVEGDGREKAVGDSRGSGSIAWPEDCKGQYAACELDGLESQAAYGTPAAGVS